MLRTASLCALLLWAAHVAAGWLTLDYQAWTTEGARRLEVARQPVATPPVIVGDAAGGAQDLRGLLANGRDVTIVEFFYTRCETICLALGSTFQQMQATLQATRASDPAAARVRLLSISFDAARDTSPDLRAYATRMRADGSVWRFVRLADIAQVQRLLADFQVVVVPDGRGDFEHNAALLVVHRDGRLLRIFDIAEQQMALDYAHHLAAEGAP